ncbi:MAG: hypothetical protein PHQ62_01930 [Clostridia bacterium]|nr:hypothetical protein [Clostridia bacterium]
MKNKIFVLLLFCFVAVINCNFVLFESNICFADTYQKQYARITADNVYFYSQPIDNPNYYLFCIAKSYFVELTANAQDTNNLFFCANYLDKSGYIKKSEVKPVIGTPQTPFADKISFRMFVPGGQELRSTPASSTPFNIITTVPYLETNLIYLGFCNGEELVSQKGNIWYYCKYISGSSVYFGYLYSAFCDLLTPISLNLENLEFFEGELFVEEINETETQPENFNISNELKIVIIVAICLPCFLIVYLLFKPTKLIIDNGKKTNSKIKKLKRSEYYELDD